MKLFKQTGHFVFILMLAFSGCGYTRKSALPEGVNTIFVETVKNKIDINDVYAYVPGMEIHITNELIKRLNVDGNLRVVQDPSQADVILNTQLNKIEQDGVRFTSLERIEEYRMYFIVSFELVEAKTKRLIFQEGNFSGDSEYFVGDIRSIAREEAAERAAVRLAKNMVDRIVEDW